MSKEGGKGKVSQLARTNSRWTNWPEEKKRAINFPALHRYKVTFPPLYMSKNRMNTDHPAFFDFIKWKQQPLGIKRSCSFWAFLLPFLRAYFHFCTSLSFPQPVHFPSINLPLSLCYVCSEILFFNDVNKNLYACHSISWLNKKEEKKI